MRLLTFASLLILSTFLFSCEESSKQLTPEDAARGFFTALAELDFETAKTYATESTQQSLKLIEVAMNMSSEEDKAELKKQFAIEIKEVTCAEVDGQTSCKICCDASGGEAPVNMVQEDNKWYVNLEMAL
ncbi:MAG: DUF4878 domain-containing protein [Aureispira sp.]|nr:DUF4878 domain-containing protein [Aureispira sp.]